MRSNYWSKTLHLEKKRFTCAGMRCKTTQPKKKIDCRLEGKKAV